MRKKKILLCVLLAVGLLVADRTSAFSITPPRYLLTIKQGEKAAVAVTIANDKEKTANYNLLVLGAEQDNEGHPVFKNNVSVAEQWVRPETEFISIGGQEKKTVNFLISIPEGAYPGFYYLGMTVKERDLSEGDVALSGRLAAILSLQVAGEAREILRIDRWEKQAGGNNWMFSTVLENKGNVDLPLRGEIVVRDWLKKEVGRQAVYLGNNLLPNTTRNLSLNFNQEKLPWSGWYWTSLQINYGRAGGMATETALQWNPQFGGLTFAVVLFIVILILFKVFLKRHKM